MSSCLSSFFFKQKTAYEMPKLLEFRRVLFRSQDQFAPTLPAADAENAGDFFQIGGNGHGAGDHVEQNVPLRAEQQQNDRAESQTSAQANQDQQHNREQRRRWNRGGNLRERLSDARQARVESDGNTGRNRPEGAEHESEIHAQEGGSEAYADLMEFGALQPGQDHDHAHHGVADRTKNRDSHHPPEPQSRFVLAP